MILLFFSSNRHWGTCKQLPNCDNINEIFWPSASKCYEKLTRGPCQKGQLLTLGSDLLPKCKCNNNNQDLNDFYSEDAKGCYQHFTRGPCREKGHLFLPDRSCGCHNFLPHYHEDSQECFEIGKMSLSNLK